MAKGTSREVTVRRKLKEAWRNGLNDREAACWAAIPFSQLQEMLANDESMRTVRMVALDTLNIKAKMNVAKKIGKGDIKTSMWHLEHRDPDYSKKSDVSVRSSSLISMTDKQSELDRFLDGYRASGEVHFSD